MGMKFQSINDINKLKEVMHNRIALKIHFFRLKKIIIPLLGFFALLWFLLRVIPKPSRASYPCQRAAMPMATGFIIWFSGFLISTFLVKKVRGLARSVRPPLRVFFILLAPLAVSLFIASGPVKTSYAGVDRPVYIPLAQQEADSYVTLPKAEVAIVRSEKGTAEEITAGEIEQMVREAVAMAGGLGDLIHDMDVVVLKPNLVNPSQEGHNETLRKEVNGVTTDYRVIQAVVNLVREVNPNGKILIMEGSAYGKTIENMEALGWLGITGVDQFIGIEDSSGAMRDYNSSKLIKRSLTPGRNLYKAASNIYYLNKKYFNADVLISIPVLKTHGTAAFTGGIKNLGIGATPASIYGDESGETNLRWPYFDHTSSYDCPIHDWIHDYYLCKPADFVIMDALTGLELGPGISEYADPDKVRKNTRCVLAGKDAVALDAIAALAVQVDPAKVRYLVTLHNDNAGCADTKYIRVKGIPLDQIREYYRNDATYAGYNDLTAPVVSVQSFSITDDTLYLSLKAESQLRKIEVTVSDTLLDNLYTGGFNDLRIALGKAGIEPEQIRLNAYDPYLNCKTISLVVSSAGRPVIQIPELKVYPNPFVSRISVSISGLSSASVQIVICDLSGKEVMNYRFQADQGGINQSIDLSDLPDGIYLITLTDGRNDVRQKIIKQ